MTKTMPTYARSRAACMVFFFGPGLAYGLFTSRMPALKAQTGATESELGLILLTLGIAATFGLLLAGRAIAHFGVRRVMVVSSVFYCLAMLAGSQADSPLQMAGMLAVLGLSFGFADVSMNVQGIEIERRFRRASMSLLHAGYNIGGITGSTLGSLFAAAALSPFVNFAVPITLFACLLIWAQRHLLEETAPVASEAHKHTASNRPYPFFIAGCGLLAMVAYVSEGSVAEWGSLFLYQVKQTPESTAALAFGSFSACALACRLVADRLRTTLGDSVLATSGACLALCGMALVLFAPWWPLSLAGYALMGLGLGPIVPIVFSRAGRHPGISPERATSIVSVFAYSGLLFWPPAFGFLAERFGLTVSLSCVLGLLAFLTAGTALLLRKPPSDCGNERT